MSDKRFYFICSLLFLILHNVIGGWVGWLYYGGAVAFLIAMVRAEVSE